MKIRFCLNGKELDLETRPDERVIDLLREGLGLTGAKESCGSGECGSCTVLVDGETRLSCLMLAAQLEGRSITTIEGLSQGDHIHPLQEAFIEKGAVQCGYCTPGMVITGIEFLTRNPHPTRDEIKAALAGNLCRCTGYQKIVDALEAFSERKGSEAA
jgi:carbon-monoxide dehydrogenase small subunit